MKGLCVIGLLCQARARWRFFWTNLTQKLCCSWDQVETPTCYLNGLRCCLAFYLYSCKNCSMTLNNLKRKKPGLCPDWWKNYSNAISYIFNLLEISRCNKAFVPGQSQVKIFLDGFYTKPLLCLGPVLACHLTGLRCDSAFYAGPKTGAVSYAMPMPGEGISLLILMQKFYCN